MSFFRVRRVSHPRKAFICGYCRKGIIGPHIYFSGKSVSGDFCTFRAHEECYQNAVTMCAGCDYKDDCQEDPRECYQNMERNTVE